MQGSLSMLTYMLYSVVAHTAAPDLALVDGVLDGFPACQPSLGPAVRAVQEEQVDVAQSTGLDAARDTLANGIVRSTGSFISQ